MPFNRMVPEAHTPFSFICRKDTALCPPKLPEAADAAELMDAVFEMPAIKALGRTREFLENTILRFVALDEEETQAYNDQGAGVRLRFKALGIELDRVPLGAAVAEIEEWAAIGAYRMYLGDGEEKHLSFSETEAPFKWRLRHLTPAERSRFRAQMKGTCPTCDHEQYLVSRDALRIALVGCDGWDGVVLKKKKVADATFDRIPSDWVTEMGKFLIEFADIRDKELKA